MAITEDFIWRFTPSRTEPELLESIFVQRRELLDDLLERIRESATTGNKHHMLLIGPRGIGKTHLIALLNHRIRQQPKLAKKLRIAWFLEDETITSFVQLLKRVYELLSEEYPDEFPGDWLEQLLEQSPEQIEKSLEEKLVSKFAKQTLLLFIENLDYVFDGLGIDGQQKWRSFLQEHPFTCLVATSQRLFSGVQKREQPFFGFFAPIHLKPLQVSDAVGLLSKIAEQRRQTELQQYLHTPEGRSRIRALHHLAGGNHRIYIVLSGFITRESLDELTQPFEKMADELTPYYQERMRWLSPQQRQIVEFLCSQDSPCTPKEIARQLLAAENTISSQLKKLLELGYVLRSPRGRESLYELAEPLMRLASEVKEKRQRPLRLLVDFLRIWYRPDHLSRLMESGCSESLRPYLSAAIDRSQESSDPRLRAIHEEIERARKEGRLQDLVDALEEQANVDVTADNWFEFGYSQLQLDRYEEAIESFDKALEIDPADGYVWGNKGNACNELGQYDKALESFNHATKINPGNTWFEPRRLKAIFALGHWEEGFYAFRDAFVRDPHFRERDFAAIIGLIERNNTIVDDRRQHVQTLVDIFTGADAVAHLGKCLIYSLPEIDAERLSEIALQEWRDLWLDIAGGIDEMQLPLRIFRVGIEYLIKQDESVMLDLIATERRILRQALGQETVSDEPSPQ